MDWLTPARQAWIVGAALFVVIVYAIVRRWILSKTEREEAKWVKTMSIHFTENEPPELPPGLGG